MPTYEYKCFACEHRFERFQSITAEPIKKCPECGKKKVRRLLGTGAGMIFKGSGFYITDYRSDSYKNSAKAESGGPSADSASPKGPASSDGAAVKGGGPADTSAGSGSTKSEGKSGGSDKKSK